MAKTNYAFEKRQKELAKNRKKEEKRLKKLDKGSEEAQSDQLSLADDQNTPVTNDG